MEAAIAIVAGAPAVLNALKEFNIPVDKLPGVASTAMGRYALIGFGVFILAIIRFPRVAFTLTRWILGAPPKPANLPRIFRGPRPYGSQDGSIFRGRETELEDCRRIVQTQPFVVLEGESGCGKSSFLDAALVPLAREKFDIIECRIGSDPIGKLHSALLQKSYQQEDEAVSQEALRKAFARRTKRPRDTDDSSAQTKPLLVCIDQFEELFVTVKSETRIQFLSVLKDLVGDETIHLLLSIRSDFTDLLNRLCRTVDPKQESFDLGSYYTLRAFSKERAERVLNQMLEPGKTDDPLLRQETEDFAEALIRELLRPSQDKRVYQEDRMTVLPVELQTVGLMIELVGTTYFTVAGLRRLGGKAGLLRGYVEEAKTYVWRKTGIPPEQALLVLRQLISPAQTKWARTTGDIADALGLPSNQVTEVLNAFADRYLVNRLPAEETASDSTDSSILRYELMHEHLVWVLREAPDPFLRRAQQAEERLRFWTEQTGPPAKRKLPPLRALVAWTKMVLAQPIPISEVAILWRFTNSPGQRSMLWRNLRAFLLRPVFIATPFTLAWIVWQLIINSDSYQIREIVDKAPAAQAAANNGVEQLIRWNSVLCKAGKFKDVLNQLNEIHDVAVKAKVLAGMCHILHDRARPAEANETFDQTLLLLPQIRHSEDQVAVLNELCLFLSDIAQTNDGKNRWNACLGAASKLDVVDRIWYVFELAQISVKAGWLDESMRVFEQVNEILSFNVFLNEDIWRSGLIPLLNFAAANGKADQVEFFWSELRQVSEENQTSGDHGQSLNFLAARLRDAGRNAEANQILQVIQTPFFAEEGSYMEIKELINDGELRSALQKAEKLQYLDRRVYAFCEIASAFYRSGQQKMAESTWEEGSQATRALGDPGEEALLMLKIAESLAKSGNVDRAMKLWDEVLPIASRIESDMDRERHVRVIRSFALVLVKTAESSYTAGVLKEAERLTHAIREDFYVSEAFKDLSELWTEIGRYEEAFADAASVKSELDRAAAIRTVSTAAAAKDHLESIQAYWATSPSDPYSYPAAITLASQLAKKNKLNQATATLSEASIRIASIPDDAARQSAVAEVATAYAHLKMYRRARQMCQECTATQRLQVYAEILSAYIESGGKL